MNFNEYYSKWLEDHAYPNSKIVRGWLKISYYTCTRIFLPLKFTPLKIDFLSLALSLLILVLFSIFPYLDATGLFLGAFLIVFFIITIAMMDNIDGALARLTNKKTPKGSYQDLIFDRTIDGIILIGPIFSGYTNMSSVLFLLLAVYLFENLRSIHISAGISIFSTVAERHARIVFQVGYIVISSCGFYLVSLGYVSPILIGGRIINFWPNLDILYLCLGLISIIGILQLLIKIGKTETAEIEFTLQNKEIIRIDFEETFNYFVIKMFLYEYRINIKRLSYFQGNTLHRIFKKPKNFFIATFIVKCSFFLLLFIKINSKSLNPLIDLSFIISLLLFFLIFFFNLKKFLNYSIYRKSLSVHHFISFNFSELITETLLLIYFALNASNNNIQIFVIFCLIVQLCHSVNIINRRRKVNEKKAYFSHVLINSINLFSLLFGVFFNFSFIVIFYCLICWTIFLSFFLIINIYNANRSL